MQRVFGRKRSELVQLTSKALQNDELVISSLRGTAEEKNKFYTALSESDSVNKLFMDLFKLKSNEVDDFLSRKEIKSINLYHLILNKPPSFEVASDLAEAFANVIQLEIRQQDFPTGRLKVPRCVELLFFQKCSLGLRNPISFTQSNISKLKEIAFVSTELDHIQQCILMKAIIKLPNFEKLTGWKPLFGAKAVNMQRESFEKLIEQIEFTPFGMYMTKTRTEMVKANLEGVSTIIGFNVGRALNFQTVKYFATFVRQFDSVVVRGDKRMDFCYLDPTPLEGLYKLLDRLRLGL